MAWKYLRSEDMDIEAMNRKGLAGWELCGVVQTIKGTYYPRPTLYWKRRLTDAEREESDD